MYLLLFDIINKKSNKTMKTVQSRHIKLSKIEEVLID